VSHPPKLPARPRKLRADTAARLFDRPVESLLGIAAGPLPNSRWIEAYARLGYGVLTYKTVRTSARAAFTHPNLIHCRLGDPSVAQAAPRKLDPGAVTWAVSVGLPSTDPAEWRSDVTRARAKLHPDQILIVSVVGTPVPDGDPEQLAGDYALAARWAAEAGADVVEVHLSSPNTAGEHAQMIFENPALSALIVDRVRRAVGQRPIVAKIGATRSPRALHELASRLAPRLDGFVLETVNTVLRVFDARGSPSTGVIDLNSFYGYPAAINRAVSPTSKLQFADWYRQTVLTRLLPTDPAALSSQNFWNHMDLVTADHVLACEKQIAQRLIQRFQLDLRALVYDGNNFLTYINTRTPAELPQRGHNKQKRTDLRQVSLGLLVSTDFHIPLFHKVYAGNVNDSTEFRSITAELSTHYRQLAESCDHITGCAT
jgi:dihydroorotate dehydrogenase